MGQARDSADDRPDAYDVLGTWRGQGATGVHADRRLERLCRRLAHEREYLGGNRAIDRFARFDLPPEQRAAAEWQQR